jgi:hypothetical protein
VSWWFSYAVMRDDPLGDELLADEADDLRAEASPGAASGPDGEAGHA